MSNKKVDLNDYDVTVVSSIWLASKVIGVGVYKSPVMPELVEFAKTQVEERKPLAYFSLDGDKVNPFVVLDDLSIPPDDDDNKDGDDDDGNGGNNNGNDDIESMFKSTEEYGAMADKNQVEYINSVKDTPSEFENDEEKSEEYDKVLYNQLVAYKEVSKKKALVEVESALALYE